MERRTLLQAIGVFVVTVLAGLPFALQVGQWLAGRPDTAPAGTAPAVSGFAPAADESPGAPQRGDTGSGPAGQPQPLGPVAPDQAKAAPAEDGPDDAAPVENAPAGQPAEPPAAEPTGDPEEPPVEPPAEPTPEPEDPEPTEPVATGAADAGTDEAGALTGTVTGA